MTVVKTKLAITGRVVETDQLRPYKEGDQEFWNLPLSHAVIDEDTFRGRLLTAQKYLEDGIIPVPVVMTYKAISRTTTSILMTGFVRIGSKPANIFYEYWAQGSPETKWVKASGSNPYAADEVDWNEVNEDLTGLVTGTVYEIRLYAENEFGRFNDTISIEGTN